MCAFPEITLNLEFSLSVHGIVFQFSSEMQVSSTSNTFLSPKGAYLLMSYGHLSFLLSALLSLPLSIQLPAHQVQCEPGCTKNRAGWGSGTPLRHARQHPCPLGVRSLGRRWTRDVVIARAGSAVMEVMK